MLFSLHMNQNSTLYLASMHKYYVSIKRLFKKQRSPVLECVTRIKSFLEGRLLEKRKETRGRGQAEGRVTDHMIKACMKMSQQKKSLFSTINIY